MVTYSKGDKMVHDCREDNMVDDIIKDMVDHSRGDNIMDDSRDHSFLD